MSINFKSVFSNLVKKGGGGPEVMRRYLVKNVFNSGCFNNFIF